MKTILKWKLNVWENDPLSLNSWNQSATIIWSLFQTLYFKIYFQWNRQDVWISKSDLKKIQLQVWFFIIRIHSIFIFNQNKFINIFVLVHKLNIHPTLISDTVYKWGEKCITKNWNMIKNRISNTQTAFFLKVHLIWNVW